MYARWMLIGSIAIVALLLLDRLLLKAEESGWIYYRKRHASPGALGSAVLEIQKHLEPSKRHVIECKQEKKAEHDDAAGSGGPRSVAG